MAELRLVAGRAGWTNSDVARLLLAFILTLTSNAPCTLTWVILHVVQAGPDLVKDLRAEGRQLIWGENGKGGVDITPASLDAGHAMPLTTDVILETMRLYSCSNGQRYVESDTWLSVPAGSPSSPPPRPRPQRSVSFCATPTPPLGRSRSTSPGWLGSGGEGLTMQIGLRLKGGGTCRPAASPSSLKQPFSLSI